MSEEDDRSPNRTTDRSTDRSANRHHHSRSTDEVSVVADPATEIVATDEEILAHARVHARSVADEIGVDLDSVDWDVSARAKRRAGLCRWNADTELATIVLSRRAYTAFDRESFESVVRHELIHAWEFQTYGESSHGARFRERAREFDVSVTCDRFSAPRYRLRCDDPGCDWSLARHRASRTVTSPDRYRCGSCGAALTVEHIESGRTWRSAAGYGGAKSALGDDW